MIKRKKIGLMSMWGFGRGHCYLAKMHVDMMIPDYKVFILQQGAADKRDEEFYNYDKKDVEIKINPTFDVSESEFTNWVSKNKLDAVIFNEYDQWTNNSCDLPTLAKEMGLKTFGILVLERFKSEQSERYDRVFASSQTFCRHMRAHKVRNFTFVPYSLNLKEFPKYEKDNNRPFTFFHPGGFGGFHKRKNTQTVVTSFLALGDENAKLIITSQVPLNVDNLPTNIEVIDKDLTRKELLDIYKRVDVTVLPSKWETIGIPILESLAFGVPVITSDIPPMNEFVRTGLNGYLNKIMVNEYDGVFMKVAETDYHELKKNMETSANRTMLEILSRNSRKVIEDIYDIEKNRHYLIDFLKGELNG